MLSIHRTDARIGINTKQPKLHIEQPQTDFDIEQKQPKLVIHTEHIRVQIDQQQCFNEAGLMSYDVLSRDMVERARQAAAESIDKIVTEGNLLGDIVNGGNVIAQISYNNSIKLHDFNIVLIPKSRPEIDFIGGKLDIQVEEGYAKVKIVSHKPIINTESGQVEIFLQQHHRLEITYIGNSIDKKV